MDSSDISNSYDRKKRHCHKIKKSSTTLDVTIVPQPNPRQGTNGVYFKLQYGKGDCTLVREDLAFAHKGRKKRRIGLASFIQITDVHIIDASSPARVAFLAQYIPEFQELQDSFRPQEALSIQVADAMVRKINSIKKGPHTGMEIGFVISCGDNGDGQQINELQNYINVLDGRKVYPNTATPGRYVGVQDNFPTVNFQAYYHPDAPKSIEFLDLYKVGYGFPNYPNILNEAAIPFKPTGLIYPWYTANGNHDCTKLGNYGLNLYSMLELFDQIATGTMPDGVGSKMIEAMAPEQALAFIEALQKQDTQGVFDVIKSSKLRTIPASDKRPQYTSADFIAMHFNTTICPGPVGHGFTEENRINNTLYYTLEVSKSVSGFVLDTCNPSGNLENPDLAPDGSIGRRQLSWLESELIARHSTYFDNQGHLVKTDNCDKLCIIFSHHTCNTMDNIFNTLDAVDLDPQKINGEEFISFLQRFPNMILWINGHTHRNIVTPLKTKKCIDPPKYHQKCGGFTKNNKCNNKKYKTCKEGDCDKDGNKSHKKKYKIDNNSSSDDKNDCDTKNGKYYGYEGFWEINTASHIDFPEQSRIIEIADNQDGTLSLFGTLIDHLSPPNVDHCGCEYTITEMASISRELAYNDPFNDPRTRGGTPEDRNVELLINNPLLRDW